MGLKLPALFMAAVLGGGVSAAAAQQAPLELRFDITDYKVEGNSLLKPAEVARALAPFRGKNRDFGDVQRAVEALEAAYRKAGYAAVRVYLPEQELNEGVVVLRVVEAKVGKVAVTGNKYFDSANVRRSVPAVREATTPSAPRIADNTRLANENPAKQTRVVLKPAEQPNEVDAVIEVEDEKPWRAFLTLDNTGTPDTGDYRLGVGYQNNNLFNRDHTITAQYVTSPTEPSQVSIYSVGYRIPIYSLGDSIDLIAGYSDVDAGTTQTQAGPLAFTGQGWVFLARYNWLLPRRAEYEHRVIFGLDYRQYDNACEFGTVGSAGCGPAGASYNVQPLSVDLCRHADAHAQPGLPVRNAAAEHPRRQERLAGRSAGGAPRGGGLLHRPARRGQRRLRFLARFPGACARRRAVHQRRAGCRRAIRHRRVELGARVLRTPGRRRLRLQRQRRALYTQRHAAPSARTGVSSGFSPSTTSVTSTTTTPRPAPRARTSSPAPVSGCRFNVKKNFALRADAAYIIDGGGLQDEWRCARELSGWC